MVVAVVEDGSRQEERCIIEFDFDGIATAACQQPPEVVGSVLLVHHDLRDTVVEDLLDIVQHALALERVAHAVLGGRVHLPLRVIESHVTGGAGLGLA